jgi:hypothetical protein
LRELWERLRDVRKMSDVKRCRRRNHDERRILASISASDKSRDALLAVLLPPGTNFVPVPYRRLSFFDAVARVDHGGRLGRLVSPMQGHRLFGFRLRPRFQVQGGKVFVLRKSIELTASAVEALGADRLDRGK